MTFPTRTRLDCDLLSPYPARSLGLTWLMTTVLPKRKVCVFWIPRNRLWVLRFPEHDVFRLAEPASSCRQHAHCVNVCRLISRLKYTITYTSRLSWRMNELANMNGSWLTLLDRASDVLKLNLIQFDFRPMYGLLRASMVPRQPTFLVSCRCTGYYYYHYSIIDGKRWRGRWSFLHVTAV